MDAYNTENFEKVWQRVINSASDAPEDTQRLIHGAEEETARLIRFMKRENGESAAYAFMARRCMDRRLARRFEILSGEEKSHLIKLQSAYFILTGDTYPLKPPEESGESMLAALRERCIDEAEGEKEYGKAAADTKDPKLSRLYSSIMEDEKRHLSMIGKAIISLLF